MGYFANVGAAFAAVFTPVNLLFIFGGMVMGMIIGCIPGLSVTLGIILFLPLSYGIKDASTAIIALLAVYVGGMYGGSISAITLNTPGTNSAIATTFDGYPLAKKGRVLQALDTSLFASSLGGIVGTLLLLLLANLLLSNISPWQSSAYRFWQVFPVIPFRRALCPVCSASCLQVSALIP